MSSVMHRQRSRRRLAALTFLSNISLDGTHKDTNLGRYYNIGKPFPSSCNDSYEKENLNDVFISEKVTKREGSKRRSNSKYDLIEATQNGIESRTSISEVATQQCSQRDKFVISEVTERPYLLKKRTAHHISLIEKRNCFSSSESLGAILSGLSGRPRKLSSTSEASLPSSKEVKCLKLDCAISIKDERMVFVSTNKMPCHIFSCIPYNRFSRAECYQRDAGRRRHTSGTRPLSTISDSTDPAHIVGLSCFEDTAEISYCDLLVPSKNFNNKPRRQCSENIVDSPDSVDRQLHHPGVARCFSYEPATHKAAAHHIPHGTRSGSLQMSGSRVLVKALESGEHLWPKSNILQEREENRLSITSHSSFANAPYVPNILDDPELRAGKHRKLLRFPSYLTSVTDYTKPFELKKELNDKFKEKFPQIQLTLSKLRSIKRELLKIAKQECHIDILTVAHAYVYFEKMILKMYVNKQNRKLIAGACLILSAKMNDVKGDLLTNLIEKTETVFRLNRRELLAWEFATLVALEFGLHVPAWQVNPHYQSLLFES